MALSSIRVRLAGARARPRSKDSRASDRTPQPEERVAEVALRDDRPGIEALGLPEVLHRRVPAPEALLGKRHSPESGGIAGGQAQPLLVLLQGAVVVVGDQPFEVAERQVPLRAVRRERDGLLRRLPGTLRERGRGCAVGVQERIGARDSRPRLGEAGIQRHGLLVEVDLLAQAGGIAGSAIPDRVALQEGVVGGEILRGLLGKLLLLLRPERAAQCLRHLRRDLRLHLKHVRDRRVERLLPLGRRRIRTRDISTSSGLTWTRLRASALLPAHRRGQQIRRRSAPRRSASASWSSSCRGSSCRGR